MTSLGPPLPGLAIPGRGHLHFQGKDSYSTDEAPHYRWGLLPLPLPSFQDPEPAHHGSKHFHFGNAAPHPLSTSKIQNGGGLCLVSHSLKQRTLTYRRKCKYRFPSRLRGSCPTPDTHQVGIYNLGKTPWSKEESGTPTPTERFLLHWLPWPVTQPAGIERRYNSCIPHQLGGKLGQPLSPRPLQALRAKENPDSPLSMSISSL